MQLSKVFLCCPPLPRSWLQQLGRGCCYRAGRWQYKKSYFWCSQPSGHSAGGQEELAPGQVSAAPALSQAPGRRWGRGVGRRRLPPAWLPDFYTSFISMGIPNEIPERMELWREAQSAPNT